MHDNTNNNSHITTPPQSPRNSSRKLDCKNCHHDHLVKDCLISTTCGTCNQKFKTVKDRKDHYFEEHLQQSRRRPNSPYRSNREGYKSDDDDSNSQSGYSSSNNNNN